MFGSKNISYLLQKKDKLTCVISQYKSIPPPGILSHVTSISISTQNSTILRSHDTSAPNYLHSLPEMFSLLNKKVTPNLRYCRLRLHMTEYSHGATDKLYHAFAQAGAYLHEREFSSKVLLHLCCNAIFFSKLQAQKKWPSSFLRHINYLQLFLNTKNGLSSNIEPFDMPGLKELLLTEDGKASANDKVHDLLYPIEKGRRARKYPITLRIDSNWSESNVQLILKKVKISPEVLICSTSNWTCFENLENVSCMVMEYTHYEPGRSFAGFEIPLPKLEYFACKKLVNTPAAYTFLDHFLGANPSIKKVHFEAEPCFDYKHLFTNLSKLPALSEAHVFHSTFSNINEVQNPVTELVQFKSLVSRLLSITCPGIQDKISTKDIIQLVEASCLNLQFRLAVEEGTQISLSDCESDSECEPNPDLWRSAVSKSESFPMSPYPIFRHTGIPESSCVFLHRSDNATKVTTWEIDVGHLKEDF